MKKLLKKLKYFILQQIYLWNYRCLNKKIPTGILIHTDCRKFAFFTPESFGQALFDLTGYHIYKEQIAHYDMQPTNEKDGSFVAWCWRYKSFFFFAPVGSNRIYIALTRQFHCHHRRCADLVLEEKFEKQNLIHRVVLNYKINNDGLPVPQKTLLEQSNSRAILASYGNNETIWNILADARNILEHNLSFGSLKTVI